MIFHTRAREFIRLAAMAIPDWDGLRGMIVNPLPWSPEEWTSMRHWAMLHQLNGVVAWRCLDPRLEKAVPQDVKDLCTLHLAELDAIGEEYVAKAKTTLAPLDAAGIPYVHTSGPTAYALLGIPHWPRFCEDIDVYIPSVRCDEAQRVLDATGGSAGAPHVELLPHTAVERGLLPLHVMTRPPEFDHLEEGFMGWAPLFEGIVHRKVFGWDCPTSPTDLWLWLLADRTYGGISWQGGPLPIWALARLVNVAAEPDFSWDALVKRMAEWDGRTGEQRDALAAMLVTNEIGAQVRKEHFGAMTNIAVLGHVLRWTEEAYPGTVPESFWKAAAAVGLATGEPAAVVTSFNDDVGPRTICVWDKSPSVEGMLFDGYETRGVEARVAAGWWRYAVPGWTEPMDAPHWAVTHLAEPIAMSIAAKKAASAKQEAAT